LGRERGTKAGVGVISFLLSGIDIFETFRFILSWKSAYEGQLLGGMLKQSLLYVSKLLIIGWFKG
jgi:hypothetical protein